eukprot:4063-Heterococcus_DN1.PRE.3
MRADEQQIARMAAVPYCYQCRERLLRNYEQSQYIYMIKEMAYLAKVAGTAVKALKLLHCIVTVEAMYRTRSDDIAQWHFLNATCAFQAMLKAALLHHTARCTLIHYAGHTYTSLLYQQLKNMCWKTSTARL